MARTETKAHVVARRLVVAIALLVVAGYCYVASGTRPFTSAADTVTAVALVVGAATGLSSWLRRRSDEQRIACGRPRGRVLPWMVSLAALLVWELVTYVAGFSAGRHAFPTISSLADEAFRHRGVKAAAFACWLGLGWGVVRR